MPIPFLLAGLGVAAGIIGAGGHISATETNEKAQRLSADTKGLYNSSKTSLERAQNKTKEALFTFGSTKKKILNSSMKQFLPCYEKIKSFEKWKFEDLDEMPDFTINQEDVVTIRKMTDIYSASLSSGATGAAAGAIIMLATSGSLPIITGGLSLAGTALAAGEIGAAAGIAGSALSFGAAMTPLAAVAAPIILFTGISASIKADENLEKAQTMYAQAKKASEGMQVSEIIYRTITKQSDMLNDFLLQLDEMFSECTRTLDTIIKNEPEAFNKIKTKTKEIKNEQDAFNCLSQEEKMLVKLAAVTRSMAGAVMAMINTPILSVDGKVSAESKNLYYQTKCSLPVFSLNMNRIK